VLHSHKLFNLCCGRKVFSCGICIHNFFSHTPIPHMALTVDQLLPGAGRMFKALKALWDWSKYWYVDLRQVLSHMYIHLNICKYIDIHMSVRMYSVYICIRVYAWIYMWRYICTYAYEQKHVGISRYAKAHSCVWVQGLSHMYTYLNICIYVDIHIYIHLCVMRLCTHIYMNIYINIYIYIYIYIYMRIYRYIYVHPDMHMFISIFCNRSSCACINTIHIHIYIYTYVLCNCARI